ncbi:MAG TPA: molybdate ABC transporter substrate-binding protein [Jatrophihabitans sp.]|jgi:molybdate transport system substrate-binding protein
MKRLVGTIAATACLVLAACSSDKSGDAAIKTITVYAASSLTGTFTELGKDFEAANSGTKVIFQFGSSGDLATQITQGAPADVFASAAPKNMQTVIAAGDASSSVNFTANKAEIAVAPGNPAKISGLADLAKPDVKTALCVATAPCGALAAAILDEAAVTVSPTATPADVKSTLAVVESGDVDAAIVYVTDVAAAGDKVQGVAIPDAQNQVTTYPIAVLTQASDPSNNLSGRAEDFVDYVTSSAGQDVLTKAGFVKP